jgi:glycosyltransferase involved in cell wall biosynthesis
MKISVVTVCFNAERTIARTIESFRAQVHSDKELVIVDGGSTDETMTIIRSVAPADAVIVSEPDRGLYDAMNKGLDAFTGEAVGFLNADDRFRHGGVLSRIAETLQQADISYGHLDFIDDAGDGRIVRRWRADPHRPKAFADGWMPAHPTFYVRRAVVDAVGRFNLDYNIAADYDFMLRAMELHGFRSLLVDDVLVEMSYGGKSTAGIGAYLKSNVEALRSRRRWLAAGAVDRAFIAKPLRKVGQFLNR